MPEYSPHSYRSIVEGALNYIKHVGANHTMRGQPHPQQWLVDGLEEILRSSGPSRESVIDECIEACRREYLEDSQKDTADEVYDDAIKHCCDALHGLKHPSATQERTP